MIRGSLRVPPCRLQLIEERREQLNPFHLDKIPSIYLIGIRSELPIIDVMLFLPWNQLRFLVMLAFAFPHSVNEPQRVVFSFFGD